MIIRVAGWLVALAVVSGLVAYGLIAHHFSIVDDRSSGSYLFASLSVIGVLAITAALRRSWKLLVLIALGGAAFGLWFAHQSALSPTWLYLIQHAGAHGALAILFGTSLRPGALPVISRLAKMIHGQLSAERIRYTRQVTAAWTLFFATNAILSVALFASGQMVWWSWLVNVLALPLIALMFVIEYAVRLRLLRGIEHAGLSAGIVAWHRMRARDRPEPSDR